MKKCIYIAEIFLPNTSAYSTHVLKMCDNLSKKFDNCELNILNSLKKVKFEKLKKNYLFTSKIQFNIKNITNYKKINFIKRVIFGYKVAKNIKNKKVDLIITRSLIASFFLSLSKINHFIEIHHTLTGLTKFIFLNLDFINSRSIKKVIFISKELAKQFEVKKKIILHDAIDLKNFPKKTSFKKIKNIGYIGSLFSGRGIDIIMRLSKMNPDLNFFIVGKKKEDKMISRFPVNLEIKNFVIYSKVPKLLSQFDVLLMPYKRKVFVNSKNLNTADYCSPLKMFDYLASGKPIISSKMNGINEILKHKINSILVEGEDLCKWNNALRLLINNKNLIKKISNNALKTSKFYTWENRVDTIIKNNF
jgi:glycosyltransferase involved in cell wall biosynthesis